MYVLCSTYSSLFCPLDFNGEVDVMEAAGGEYKLYFCLHFLLVIVKTKLNESKLNTCVFSVDLDIQL